MTLFQKTDRLAFGLFPVCLIFLLVIGAGCSRSDAPPQVLSSVQLAPALEKSFQNARPGAKALVDKIIVSFKSADYPDAFTELQSLESQPGLTRGQVKTLASELFSVNRLLQSEQSQGNQQAARTLQHYQATK